MKGRIIGWVKFILLVLSMTLGFWISYAFVWYAVGLPLKDWALWMLLAIAGLTEYGYCRWINEG